MALIRIEHVPKSVQQTIPLHMVLPDPVRWDGPLKDQPVLFLLHGLGEDGGAWLRHTLIETLAEQIGFVVVAPSCGRSFYADLPNGAAWFTYLTEELPAWLKDVFQMTLERERTFVCGSSMGGYGAMKAALLRPDLYGAAGSFSGALSLDILKANPDDERRKEFAHLFGDLSKLAGGEHDPLVWLKKADKTKVPPLMVTCGQQDELLPFTRQFAAAGKEAGIDMHLNESAGGHDWFFWNRQLSLFLAFALNPLQKD